MRTLAAVTLAVGASCCCACPLAGAREQWRWISLGCPSRAVVLGKAFGTAWLSYAASEAFNLFALLGQLAASGRPFLFSITYGQWGTACMVLCVLAALWMYIRGRKEKGCLPLSLAFCWRGCFTLGQYVRTLSIPVLLLLMVSFIAYEDRPWLFLCYVGFTCSLLLNSWQPLWW